MLGVCSTITGLVACSDLLIKNWVEKNVPFRKDKIILKGHGFLRKVHNKGMLLNFADKHSSVVKVISILVTLVTVFTQFVICQKAEYEKESLALAFVLGGAISNTVDRIKRGYVVDYLAFNSKNKKISKITYNIGDFAIFAGVILVLLSAFSKEK